MQDNYKFNNNEVAEAVYRFGNPLGLHVDDLIYIDDSLTSEGILRILVAISLPRKLHGRYDNLMIRPYELIEDRHGALYWIKRDYLTLAEMEILSVKVSEGLLEAMIARSKAIKEYYDREKDRDKKTPSAKRLMDSKRFLEDMKGKITTKNQKLKPTKIIRIDSLDRVIQDKKSIRSLQ